MTLPVIFRSLDFGATAAAIPWYLSGGISAANCIAAYQPIGAASLAASYSNLITPGTYNAAPGTAPTWDATNGWKFAAASVQYLISGVTPADGWSAIVRFSNVTNGGAAFGELGSCNATFGIRPYRNSNQIQYLQGATANNASGGLTSGTVAIANQIGYKNGASDVAGIGAWTGSAPSVIWIGTINAGGNPATYIMDGYIQAFAIYNTPLDGTQIGLLHTAMAAL